jgi:hypothetical protein
VPAPVEPPSLDAPTGEEAGDKDSDETER